jgi:hypothetical protein
VILEPAQCFIIPFTDVVNQLGECFAVFGNALGNSDAAR